MGLTIRPSSSRLFAGLGSAIVLVVGLLLLWKFLPEQASPAAGTPDRAQPVPGEPADAVTELPAPLKTRVKVEGEHAAPVPEARLRIAGVVVDAAWPPGDWPEAPAPNALVRIFLDGTQHQVTTDAEGRFELELDDDGRRPLMASLEAEGNVRRHAAKKGVTLRTGQRKAEVRLARAVQGPLEGSVVDLEGNALAGVRVTLRSPEDELVRRLTDSTGRFTVEALPWSWTWDVNAQLAPLWTLWSSSGLHPDAEGGWEPLRLTMVGSGSLEVLVEDVEGEPVKNVTVTVWVAESDRTIGPGLGGDDDPPSTTIRFPEAGLSKATGADGIVRFDDAWAERRLLVWIAPRPSRPRAATRHLQGRLVFEGEPLRGEAIRVPVGGSLVLRARLLGVRRRLTGRVTYPDGRPVNRPHLRVEAIERDPSEPARTAVGGSVDGTYAATLDEMRPGETLRIRAADALGDESHAGGLDVVVGEGNLRADIVVEPMLSISGRILAPGRPGLTWDVLAEPEQPAPPATSGTGYVRSDAEGNFEFASLAPGHYELVVYRQIPLAEEIHRFQGIPAGTSGLTLEIPQAPRTALTITLMAPRPVGEHFLFVAQPLRRNPEAREWPAAITRALAARIKWPEGRKQRSRGWGECLVDGTRFQYRSRRGKASGSPPRELLRLPAGVYAIGIDAWDTDGRPFAPMLAAPARYSGGDHELVIELVPTASITGQVAGADPDLGLELIVLDTAGERLPLFGGDGKAARSLPIDFDGSFELDRLPAGTVVLRVGPPWDLEHGGTVIEQEVELTADETASVEIQWR